MKQIYDSEGRPCKIVTQRENGNSIVEYPDGTQRIYTAETLLINRDAIRAAVEKRRDEAERMGKMDVTGGMQLAHGFQVLAYQHVLDLIDGEVGG